MRMPFLFTAEGRKEVAEAKEIKNALLEKQGKGLLLKGKEEERLRQAQGVTRRDFLQKVFCGTVAVPGLGAAAWGLSQCFKGNDAQADAVQNVLWLKGEAPHEQFSDLQFERDTPPETCVRLKANFERARNILIREPDFRSIQSADIEYFPCADLPSTLERMRRSFPQMQIPDPHFGHADALTTAFLVRLETGQAHARHLMILPHETIEDFTKLVGSLEHEYEHILINLRAVGAGRDPPNRRESEVQAYRQGIQRLPLIIQRLRASGVADDQQLAASLETTVMPVLQRRMRSWDRER